MNNMIEIEHLTKRFPGFALQDVTFALPQGFIMGLIGPNGAGKTTTIKLILNMLTRDQGAIRVFGCDNRTDEAAIKERIGVVFDQPFYVEEWTLHTVERALAPFYRTWQHARYTQLLQDFELDPNKKVKELSRGMKLKLMIAAALSHDAQLLILDEPTSGLDPVARDELLEILTAFMADEQHGAQRGILFSTHITSDLEKIADYITFMGDGAIVYTGTKDELLERAIIVRGGRGELNAAQRARVVGYREYSAGFEALTNPAQLAQLPKGLLYEPATLEEIIIYMNKEKRNAKVAHHV